MTDSITIPRAIAQDPSINYHLLRDEGLKHIEQLAAKLWTDYNTHDPGITMMEMLCYAITDLGLRIDLPIEDILAEEKYNLRKMHEQFHSALEILPSAPITERDYRKLFIHIKGIKNAWLELHQPTVYLNYREQPPLLSYQPFVVPHEQTSQFDLKGIYNIIIEPEATVEEADYEALKAKVVDVFHRNRNLCEDLNEVRVVDRQRIAVCAEIELEPNADAEAVHAEILFQIQQYFTPAVPFHTLKEMLEKKKTSDEIFQGPLFKRNLFNNPDFVRRFLQNEAIGNLVADFRDFLESLDIPPALLDDPEANEVEIRQQAYEACFFYGFIDNDELDAAKLRQEVRTSDLIRIIMEIEGVRFVKDIYLDYCQNIENDGSQEISGDQTEWRLCIDPGHQPILCADKTVINYYKDVLLLQLNKAESEHILNGLNEAAKAEREAVGIEDLPMPVGSYKNVSSYDSIQNDFPDTYGINQSGLPDHVSNARRAQAKQLKAYLLFFDQILANYFAQLGRAKDLLAADDSLKQSYFTQAVKDIRGVKDIYRNFSDYTDWNNRLEVDLAQLDNYHERKHQLLDHLLARFAEQFNDYVFLMHELYGKYIEDTLIRQKVTFLREYPEISARRAAAFDYYHEAAGMWNTYNVSGLQHRLARLGGFRDYQRRNFSGVDYEIYQENDPDFISEYRWRVFNDDGKILLSSSMHYHDKDAAIEELSLCIVKAGDPGNYEVRPAEDATFHFVLLDGDGEVIGRRIEYFATEAEATTAMNETAAFLSGKTLTVEGMYLIEHLLLRPRDEAAPSADFMPICVEPNFDYCKPLDPYSFRISVILPGWTQRLSRTEFRQFMEKLIRLESPAHILARICWIGREQMEAFEAMYRAWLESRFDEGLSEVERQQIQNDFIELLSQLYTIYPTGRLHDCVDEGSEEEDNPIILNRTNLGTLDGTDEIDDNETE